MNLIVGYIELRFKLFNLNDLKNNMIKILLFNILEYIILFISVLLILVYIMKYWIGFLLNLKFSSFFLITHDFL